MKYNLLALVGAAVGGFLGYLGFFWILRQGFYALVLPGGLVGLGASIAKSRSLAISIVCGVAALALGIYTEWQFAPFRKDPGFGFFVSNLHHKSPVTLLMITVGAALGFWLPFSHRHDREEPAPPPEPPRPNP